MAKTIKYIPNAIVVFKGVEYHPAKPGETPKVSEGLPEKEIERLVKGDYIKKISYDDGVKEVKVKQPSNESAKQISDK